MIATAAKTLVAVSRASFRCDLLSGQFHHIRYHQTDRLSERVLREVADLLMDCDNALMRMGVA